MVELGLPMLHTMHAPCATLARDASMTHGARTARGRRAPPPVLWQGELPKPSPTLHRSHLFPTFNSGADTFDP